MRLFNAFRSAVSRGATLPLKVNRILQSRTRGRLGLSLAAGFLSTYSLLLCLNNQAQATADVKQSKVELEQVGMSELVEMLSQPYTPSSSFQSGYMIVVYDRTHKQQHPRQFATQLKTIVEQCKQCRVGKMYMISSRDQKQLEDIERRLKNIKKEEAGGQKGKGHRFECYFRNSHYQVPYPLLSSKTYTIQEQLTDLFHFQVHMNPQHLLPCLRKYTENTSIASPSTLVIKQCQKQGQCVDSFRAQVRNFLQSGMLTRRNKQFQFVAVVGSATGLLGKGSQYVRDFQGQIKTVVGEGKKREKQELYMIRRDVLGRQVRVWSNWLQENSISIKELMMFMKPRVHILSRSNLFNDFLWYLRTSRLSSSLSLSLNNSKNFRQSNTPHTLSILQLINKHYPQLELLVVDSERAGEVLKHVMADRKWVLFEQSSRSIWKKVFLDLEQLEQLGEIRMEELFNSEIRPKIDAFIKEPRVIDRVEVEKQLQIGGGKLKSIRDRQLAQKKYLNSQQQSAQLERKYVIRVCKGHCSHYLNNDTLKQLEEQMRQALTVYWIDSTAQNIGKEEGDYLLTDGQLISLPSLQLQTPTSTSQ